MGYSGGSVKNWIKALRLRTLPLAASGIIMGGALTYRQSERAFSIQIWLLTLLTAVLLQICSNLANDLGDALKGSDTHRPDRVGGGSTISVKFMKIGVTISVILTLISGLWMLYIAVMRGISFWPFFILGIISTLAALLYTLGRRAYGYFGLGDVMVFIFFGAVAVLGTTKLQGANWEIHEFLATGIVGFLSAAVLNINNIRDMETDEKAGKRTLALRLGHIGSRIYLLILIGLAFLFALIFSMLTFEYWWSYLWIIPFILPLNAALHVFRLPSGPEFNLYLKWTALGTFFLCLLLAMGLILEN